MLGHADAAPKRHGGLPSRPAPERVRTALALGWLPPPPALKPSSFFPRCPDDRTVAFPPNGTGHNGESSTVRYSFDMFRFTTEPLELYLHCTVQLCAPDDPESCKPVSPILPLTVGAASPGS